MNQGSSKLSSNPKQWTDQQWRAIATLLGDEDPTIYQMIQDKIIQGGSETREPLKRFELDEDPVVRRRVRELIHRFDRQGADNDFLATCLSINENGPLESSAWALSQTRYPDISAKGYSAVLDQYGEELSDRLPQPDKGSGRASLEIFHRYFFQELGFQGDTENYYSEENSYLSQVMDRKLGIPISLSALYVMIGRRAGLPVAGIGMPGHFMCRYQTAEEEWYVDVFHGGQLLPKTECVKRLMAGGFGYSVTYLQPATTRQVLTRMCLNLYHLYQKSGQEEETQRIRRYLGALRTFADPENAAI